MSLWHSKGCRQACWLMHQESPPGNNSNRPLFLMSNFGQPCVGTYRLPVGTYRLGIGTYHLTTSIYRLAQDTCRLAIGTYRVAIFGTQTFGSQTPPPPTWGGRTPRGGGGLLICVSEWNAGPRPSPSHLQTEMSLTLSRAPRISGPD